MDLSILKVLFLVVVILIGLALFYVAPRLIIDTNTTTQFIQTYELPKSFKKEKIKTRDGIILNAVWQNCIGTERETIVFLHGIRGSTYHFTPRASKGYNSIAIDLRAHGLSGGKFCTFGYLEKHDVQDVLNFVLSRKSANTNIGIWGQSLGGAIGLQALSIEPRLKFGIIESTFSDLSQIVYDYGNRIIPIKLNALHKFLLWRAGLIAHFPPKA